MNASGLIAALADMIARHGDLETTVRDADDLCHVSSVYFDENAGGKRSFFQINGCQTYDHGLPQPVRTPEQERLKLQIAKMLSNVSPFLNLLHGGKFPDHAGDETRPAPSNDCEGGK